ncbi:hypothetical protein Desaci_2031 [Desulfosporosinus acidiphilus SJ4]|uniref:Uncharacterized protein n=1 Tax=Desulfosporosinus acidiphilus (strain DSM 22704 / JCM 16185 / SJ4) TaxID=646529 RepID=I4D5D2_DESAJ|nr:hypothetical protein [Desulfosporosinus acidiphilus]AFM41006.1 hypothetical protein Desaci_2031 [Desulfosporosinus acidiphilus SJ4]
MTTTKEEVIKILSQTYDECKKQNYSYFMREKIPNLNELMFKLRYLEDEKLIKYLDADDGLPYGMFKFRITSKGIDFYENEIKKVTE